MTTAIVPVSRATYAQLLPKGAALLPETRILLCAWKPGEPGPAFAQRVIQEDLLGKLTARRARDIVKEVFALRFLNPIDTPARHLKMLVEGNGQREVFIDLVFYYAARRDALLRDFTVLRYWPATRTGRLTISNQDVLNFMWEAEQDGRIPRPWSSHIKARLAGTLLTALTDFGLLRRGTPGVRDVVRYRPADSSLAYLAYQLHFSGVTDSSLAEHEAWALFGLSPADVWDRLEALTDESWFLVQRAGQVVRITWRHGSMEEVVHALAG